MIESDRLGPPPVEPLSDAAWARVERGLWSRLDAPSPHRAPPPRRVFWIAAPAFAAAVAVAALALWPGDRGAPLVDDPSRIVSGAAPSTASFGGAHLELASDTAVSMRHDGGQPTVTLERGAAWFTVAPRGDRPAFVVRAGDAAVRVIGTRFEVARSQERVTVEVEHGAVEVAFRGVVARVEGHHRWSSDAPGETSVIAAAPGLPAPVAPVAAAEPPPAPSAAPAPAPVAPPAPAAPSPPRPVRPRAAPPSDVPAAPQVEPSAAAIDRDREAYERLAAEEAASPEAALAGYLALARGRGPWAGVALYAAARLAADRGDPRARALVDRYLREYPRGANAADAQRLRDQLAPR